MKSAATAGIFRFLSVGSKQAQQRKEYEQAGETARGRN
jgi:hypothetical protein